jgi:APA family basic amino acid/polyamine antiporter
MAHTKKMGLSTATLIGINSMIGAGIFTAPALLAQTVGPAALATYLFVIFAVTCMGWSFARLAQRFPEEGSFYLYTKQWAGHNVGMIAAWMYVFGILTAMGLLMERAGTYLQDYFPAYTVTTLGVSALAVLVGLNLISARIAQASQYIAICCTAFPLLAITILCLWNGNWANLTPVAPYGWMPALLASKEVIFGFFGFEGIPGIFPLVENPTKNVPRALMIAILSVSAIYFLFIFSIFLAIPSSMFTEPGMPLSHPLRELFPNLPWLVTLVHASMTISFMSVLNAVIYYVATLVRSLFKKMKTSVVKQAVTKQWINEKSSLLFVGAIILSSNLALKTLSQFFAAVSVCILFSFLSSFITLMTIKSERTVASIVAVATSSIIFGSAVKSLFGI